MIAPRSIVKNTPSTVILTIALGAKTGVQISATTVERSTSLPQVVDHLIKNYRQLKNVIEEKIKDG
ncbi:hypothetical protein ACLOJK_023915 [Asimina triloba]